MLIQHLIYTKKRKEKEKKNAKKIKEKKNDNDLKEQYRFNLITY